METGGRKVIEGYRRPWNVKEYLGKPWNTVGTNDREVEYHGRPVAGQSGGRKLSWIDGINTTIYYMKISHSD